MIYLSDGLMSALSAAFAARFAGGFIRVFSGAPPLSPNAAEAGTLLGVVSINADGTGLRFAPAVAYVYNPPGDRWAFIGVANGTAGHFRVVAPGDTGAASLTEQRLDGTIGPAFSGADMEWDSTAVVLDAIYALDSFVYIIHPIPRTLA